MRRTKEQKAITLIALIITIVLLMVLAAVAISSIQNDGIIGHAEEAKNKYTEEQQKEQDMLNYYELVLSGKAWTQNKTTVTRGNVTLEVGDEVTLDGGTYSAGDYTGDWVVLGVEYGKLLLVSSTKVGSDIALKGKDGYNNGINILNNACSNYINSDYADKVRNITVEDINRVTGYKPTTGDTFTYTSNFKHPDGREIGKNGVTSIEVMNTSYSYSIASQGFNSESQVYLKLFNESYWLASQFEWGSKYIATWGLHCVIAQGTPETSYKAYGDFLDSTGSNMSGRNFGARAVVYINPDVEVDKVS